MINDRTPAFDLPLPHESNTLEEDAQRLRDALTAVDTALSGMSTDAEVTAAVSAVVGAAPSNLNTLAKIATALGGDPAFSATVNTALAGKLAATPATSVALGGVKVGAGLVVTAEGLLSTTGAGSGTGLPLFDELTIVPTTNGQTAFTVPDGYVPGQVEVHVNGVLMIGGGDDYTASNSTSIVFTVGLNTTDLIHLRRFFLLSEELAVNKTGDTMTGHLSVPANASGSQAPQAQEVVKKAGDTMTGPLVVPAGATGSQAPRASEVVLQTQFTAAAVLAKVKEVDGAGSGLDADTLRGKAPGDFAVAGGAQLTADQLQSQDLDDGIYRNEGAGLKNAAGSAVALSGAWHVVVLKNSAGEGGAAQIAVEVGGSTTGSRMYFRVGSSSVWGEWIPLMGAAIRDGGAAPATPFQLRSNDHAIMTAGNNAILPGSPVLGDTVYVYRHDNGCTVQRNGSLIGGLAEDMAIDFQRVTVPLRYVGSSIGWAIF